jgi:hypothetical protein
MRVKFSGDTNIGRKRDHNEDSIALPEAGERLAIVCDGMGGHASGEVASRLAVELIVDHFAETGKQQTLTWPYKVDRDMRKDINRMITGVMLANLEIWERSQREPRFKGMGTTCTAAVFGPSHLSLAQVGDRRQAGEDPRLEEYQLQFADISLYHLIFPGLCPAQLQGALLAAENHAGGVSSLGSADDLSRAQTDAQANVSVQQFFQSLAEMRMLTAEDVRRYSAARDSATTPDVRRPPPVALSPATRYTLNAPVRSWNVSVRRHCGR